MRKYEAPGEGVGGGQSPI